MKQKQIPFSNPYQTGLELRYIEEACSSGRLAGDGPFTQRCHDWLERETGVRKALLTHSCTAALEMCAILADIRPGDEIIMPSYTFVSTANAFVLRGGVPVFIDVRADTLNMDENLIQSAITSRTRAILPVHYAGVACEMDTILEIARQHQLLVIEDAAQGIMADYQGKSLGSMGDLGTLSFHESKNIVSGEAGTLLISNWDMAQRAEIIREKGTDRSQFVRGEIDKYKWIDIGSSYLPGELISAFLWAQLEQAKAITDLRLAAWQTYHDAFSAYEQVGRLTRPTIPDTCRHNGHIYYLLLQNLDDRNRFIAEMEKRGVNCVFHYVPLHSSPAGENYGKAHGNLAVTEDIAQRLVRLPLSSNLQPEDLEYVIDAAAATL